MASCSTVCVEIRHLSMALCAAAAAMMLASCATSPRGEGGSPSAVGGADAEEALRGRAVQLWEAKRQEDWASVFQFQDPAVRQRATVSEFATWSEEKEPFRVESFSVGEVIVEGEWGWVELDCRFSMRRFPNTPAREVKRWEKWHQPDGVWLPVQAEMADACPDSPALRNPEEETRLLARYEESWEARQRQDWDRLEELTDPRDRVALVSPEMKEKQGLIVYLEHEVQWVEVIGNRGTVRAKIKHRLNDPSLTKLAPRVDELNEAWVKFEGTWYMNLSDS